MGVKLGPTGAYTAMDRRTAEGFRTELPGSRPAGKASSPQHICYTMAQVSVDRKP